MIGFALSVSVAFSYLASCCALQAVLDRVNTDSHIYVQTSLNHKLDLIKGRFPHLSVSFQDNKHVGVQHVAQHPAALPKAGEHHPDPGVSRQGANQHCALSVLKLSAGVKVRPLPVNGSRLV